MIRFFLFFQGRRFRVSLVLYLFIGVSSLSFVTIVYHIFLGNAIGKSVKYRSKFLCKNQKLQKFAFFSLQTGSVCGILILLRVISPHGLFRQKYMLPTTRSGAFFYLSRFISSAIRDAFSCAARYRGSCRTASNHGQPGGFSRVRAQAISFGFCQNSQR